MDSDSKNYNLSSIAGHKRPILFLNGLLAEDRMPSGLLFYGQKNIGKRFTATAFAASVLCRDYAIYKTGSFNPDIAQSSNPTDSNPTDSNPTDPSDSFGLFGSAPNPIASAPPEPPINNAPPGPSLNFCGKCPPCMSILNGTSQNLMLVEPSGSSIKIENIHRIGSFLSLTPAYPGHRFIIIDDASSMNASAANALLKMLEEPQEKTVFILIVSNVSMLLPTVISRCLLLGFSPIPDEVLSAVFNEEFPALEDNALKLYSKLARGSYSGFRSLIEGKYLEKRNFLINNVFKELFKEYKSNNNANPYDISAKFNIMEKDMPKKSSKGSEKGLTGENEDKSAGFELILSILRDIYVYYMSKNEKLLYNEDIADEIKRFAVSSGINQKELMHMMESTAEHIEKINSYNLNKSISVDSYFYELLSV